MYWEVRVAPVEGEGEGGFARTADGRFVLHRHRDSDGAHLDLRLEQAGYLMGWRIEGEALADGAWAAEKSPHPLRWLEQDGAAVREDAGTYVWVRREDGLREVELRGQAGTRRVTVTRMPGLSLSAVREVKEAIRECGVDEARAGALILDGALARTRALERLCGLGRELDGAAFDGAVWRETLAGRSLAEIQAHLRGLELRFDRKYPPCAVSRPEALEEEADGAERALAILGAAG